MRLLLEPCLSYLLAATIQGPLLRRLITTLRFCVLACTYISVYFLRLINLKLEFVISYLFCFLKEILEQTRNIDNESSSSYTSTEFDLLVSSTDFVYLLYTFSHSSNLSNLSTYFGHLPHLKSSSLHLTSYNFIFKFMELHLIR